MANVQFLHWYHQLNRRRRINVHKAANLRNCPQKVTPPYPVAAREQRIEGSVQMTALLGLDGTVLKLNVDSGPPELVDGSVRAALQWVYKPTLLNGKPCFVITRIPYL